MRASGGHGDAVRGLESPATADPDDRADPDDPADAADAADAADRMLADPHGYFSRARERARAEIGRDIECEIRRLCSP
jgi:hypothetical protein